MTQTVNTPTVDVQQAERAIAVLAPAWTTRIIIELDDYGPLPASQQGSVFPDIPHKLRAPTLRSLQQRHLITTRRQAEETVYDLTPAAAQLGPVYDTLNTWARTHLPATFAAPYTARVDITLNLLRQRQAVPLLTGLAHAPRTAQDLAVAAVVNGDRRAVEATGHQLSRLTEAGLVTQVTHPAAEAPSYALTTAGIALLEPLEVLSAWAAEHPGVHATEAAAPVLTATRFEPPSTTLTAGTLRGRAA
ncbi:winged helix-turn-helix transcriptional regulator [Streptomyces olivoreticuli]